MNFRQLSSEKSWFDLDPYINRIQLEMNFLNRINSDQKDDLEREIDKEEVKRAVWDICGIDEKAPGTDGFQLSAFTSQGVIPKGGNSSFITLITKIPNANMVKDFRPISLIGSLYKIITKILANHLVTVLGTLVNKTQSAFVADRQILDMPFILNELVQWCKKKKKQAMIFKVDFEKAYDSVRWDFLDDILKKFEFGEKWCNWIQSCLRSSRGSVIVNGSPTKEFQFYKGLKQGDPLSPFLFILVMESLHVSFQRVVDAGLFKGIVLSPSLNILHLFYADDAIFMGQWSQTNIDTITHVLECFHRASGLRINMIKSKLMGISVDISKVEQAAAKIGCVTLKTPFNYLGLKVGGLMSRLQSWNEIVESIATRLSRWKLKTLSIGGRLTLLKSVLGAIPIYHMSIFEVPMKVLQRMESIRSRFFNGVDIHSKNSSWVRWKNVMASKDKGGLGVSSLFALNRALMFKWVWRFISQSSLLWAMVIKALHGEDSKIVGNGANTSFWEVAWRGDSTFKDLFPRMYALESLKSINVASKLSHCGLAFSFRRNPRGGVEQAQFDLLKDKVEDDVLLPDVTTKTRWIKVVPIKVNVHAWKVKLDCLPTRFNISRRGMDIESILCPICGNAVESSRHLFFTCRFSSELMRKISRWWDIDYMEISSYEEWLDWILNLRLSLKHKQILEAEKTQSAVTPCIAVKSELLSEKTSENVNTKKMPDKCWAGICLLGVTCEGCSPERFLASYSVWFQKLLSHLQPPAESHFVKAACCVSLSDLLTRLSGLQSTKRDGTTHAARLFQPVLNLMHEDSSDAEGAASLLCTILTLFPSALQKTCDSAEAAIVAKIMSGKCTANMLKKLARCLSLLPKSKGDEDSWSLMIYKVLVAINVLLNDSFQGLEEETRSREIMRALVPPKKDSPASLGTTTTTIPSPPAPLGGLTILDISNKAAMQERVSMPSISALMLCCSTMLTTSYPAKAKLPVRLLLMLVERVLMVDGSLPHTLYPTITAMQQEYVCLEFLVQHSYCLEILCGIVKAARSQLLPHAAHMIRIVTEYLRRCEQPELRIKLYALIKLMLLSMGVGLTIYLAEDVVSNASIDLGSVGDRGGEACSNSEPVQKKRKHEMPVTSHENQSETIYTRKNPVPISLKIAALEALETLLTVWCGSTRHNSFYPSFTRPDPLPKPVTLPLCVFLLTRLEYPIHLLDILLVHLYGYVVRRNLTKVWMRDLEEDWRSNVDLLIKTVATDACNGGWTKPTNDFNNTCSNSSSWADFQLASLRALLASLLSPGRVRPPYLAHGLELFRKGKQGVGSKLAEFCAHALMTLEVLIHPRAIPLIDFGSSIEYSPNDGKNRFMDNNLYFGSQKHNPVSAGTSRNGFENPESEEDDLYEKWVKDNDANEPLVTEQPNNTTTNEITPPLSEKLVSIEAPSSAKTHEDKEKGIMLGGQSLEIFSKQSEVLSQTVDFRASDKDMGSKGNTLVSDFMSGLGDNDDPIDEIPDIVDVEPDSSDDE
ncbi:RNA-directed DNA polymerase, eukaryota, reverse transcriptase zinc-binding domain protein [Tanacetum coccineum]